MKKQLALQFYVYTLTDPRDLSVFYIGKGKANRRNMHTHKVEVADNDTTTKAQRIRDILDAGEEVLSTIVKRFDDEADALDYEEQLINKIGLANLTNKLSKGVANSKAKPKQAAKLTLKQEGFVRSYIENGGNATQAYRDNYAIKTMTEKSINEESSVLLKNPKIASRLKEYNERTQLRHQISVDTLTTDMIENRELALSTAQAGAAQNATMGLAKLHGLLVEKQTHEVSIAVGFAERLAARRIADA